MNRISAKIVADSQNEFGDRLTTMVLTFPRMILAEFNTHRAFGRNSASSRAIPFKRMLELVRTEPFIPIAWQKEHTGMQGTEYFTEEKDINGLRNAWIIARDSAVRKAIYLNSMQITKQLCNRVLEPFMYHTVIVTATEWWNFFNLRYHPGAEIHMQDLAKKMYEAYKASEPQLLKEGQWHIPFNEGFETYESFGKLTNILQKNDVNLRYDSQLHIKLLDLKVKIATARCARVSYLNFEGKDDYEADVKLHDQLLQNGHFSPFEHCGQAMGAYDYIPGNSSFNYDDGDEGTWGWSGNFKGFVQYRKTLKNENNTKSF